MDANRDAAFAYLHVWVVLKRAIGRFLAPFGALWCVLHWQVSP